MQSSVDHQKHEKPPNLNRHTAPRCCICSVCESQGCANQAYVTKCSLSDLFSCIQDTRRRARSTHTRSGRRVMCVINVYLCFLRQNTKTLQVSEENTTHLFCSQCTVSGIFKELCMYSSNNIKTLYSNIFHGFYIYTLTKNFRKISH